MEHIQAKETIYNGYRFRSKLEAKWAVFFDKLNVTYQYEPEAFRCSDGSQYTPDFYLPDSFLRTHKRKGLYLEIKPLGFSRYFSHENQTYVRRIATALESANLCLFTGDPHDLVFGPWNESNEQLCPDYDNFMVLMYCDECGALKADFLEGSYMICPNCEADTEFYTIKAAATYARQYRFQFFNEHAA